MLIQVWIIDYTVLLIKHVNVRALHVLACVCTHRSQSCYNSLDFTNPLCVTKLQQKEREGVSEGKRVRACLSKDSQPQLCPTFLSFLSLSLPSFCFLVTSMSRQHALSWPTEQRQREPLCQKFSYKQLFTFQTPS